MSSRAAALILLTSITLTGCGVGGKASADGDEAEVGPLGKYFEQAYGEFDEDQSNRDMQRMEEIVAECMAEQGFEYIPIDHSAQAGFSVSSEDLDVEWGSREFAEEYGYGITNDPFAELHESAPPPEEEFVDPNAEYIEAMSEAEAEAYFKALHGNPEVPDDPEAEYEYNWEENGCHGRANYEVYEARMEDPALTSLEDEMSALWEQTRQDPRVTEATTAWIDCMGDAGYTGLATVDDAQMQISDKSNAVYEEAYGDGSMEEMPSEEDIAAIEAQIEEKLATIREEEIAMAVADFECREEADYDDTLQEVSFELEQEFVDTHKEELEAWVEAVIAQNS